ncbi:MAG: hypothetical protein ACJAYB_001996 [Psychromonas sp.]
MSNEVSQIKEQCGGEISVFLGDIIFTSRTSKSNKMTLIVFF